jgi:hypothetical protein
MLVDVDKQPALHKPAMFAHADWFEYKAAAHRLQPLAATRVPVLVVAADCSLDWVHAAVAVTSLTTSPVKALPVPGLVTTDRKKLTKVVAFAKNITAFFNYC